MTTINMMAAMHRPKLAISFSGGKTSGYMTDKLLKERSDTHEIIVTFANTGCEHPATLDFVDACDRHWGNVVVWLEAEVDPAKGKGIRHREVDYLSASRDGRPFRDYIAKYGIPNQINPTCTTKLKQLVMESYLRTRGFVRGKHTMNYDTAIGIRADEMDRVVASHKEQRLIYPLCDAGVRKADVLAFWRSMPFDLRLPGEHYGNCTWCWKKSNRKLLTLAMEAPEMLDFPAQMEREFGTFKADLKAGHNGRRYFFRGYKTTDDLKAIAAAGGFTPFVDAANLPFDEELDVGSGCGESCEIGADR